MGERTMGTMSPEFCEFCLESQLLHPYGPNGEYICYHCAMKDEDTTIRRFLQHEHGEGFDA